MYIANILMTIQYGNKMLYFYCFKYLIIPAVQVCRERTVHIIL